GVHRDVPVIGGNAAQRREHDKRIGQGTMSGKGAWCPCCGKPGTVAMGKEDIRQAGLAGCFGAVMTALVVNSPDGKEYRLPIENEIVLAVDAERDVQRLFDEIPFGVPDEPIPRGGSRTSGGTSF